MKKTVIIFVLAIIILVTPLTVVTTTTLTAPCQYDQTFLAELKDKHERLSSIKEEKIVLIGGSNLAFGLDSQKLHEYVGMPVVNYGLYATIGTKAMLDMSRSHIKKGDIVVICPETDKQTYSLYYNAHSMWQALDCDLSMFKDVGFSNWGKLIAVMPEFAAEKRGFIKKNTKPAPSGIYAKASFNEYGDIAVERPYNIMPTNYDISMPVSLTTDLLDKEFIDYLNRYADECKLRGATVYFGFSPINSDSVVSTDEEKEEFYEALTNQLDFPLISDIDDYILDSAYFYDTNFHLNSCGALQRTSLLADDLLRELGKTEQIETEKYTPPTRPADFFATQSNNDNNAKHFIFEEIDGGLSIVGLSEAGKQEKTLTIPKEYDGKSVLVIGDNAFAGSDVLERVIIKEDAAVKSFTSNALSNCPALRAIEIHLAPSALPINPEAVTKMPKECLVYVPADRYSEFATDYFWTGMMQYVEILE
ncbi:MAG: hypothetical protein IKV81_02995 [Clostridia bacterium]|nr:hypothetical protein [Clostridia bacterium]